MYKNLIQFKNRKLVFMTSLVLLSCSVAMSQGNGVNSKFTKGGDNLTSNEAVLGSTNNIDFKFITNNQTRLILDASGVLRLINLSGLGTRLITTDANGNLAALPQGTTNQVLYGNGTWGALPASASIFTTSGNNLILPSTSKLGIGITNPTNAFEVG